MRKELSRTELFPRFFYPLHLIKFIINSFEIFLSSPSGRGKILRKIDLFGFLGILILCFCIGTVMADNENMSVLWQQAYGGAQNEYNGHVELLPDGGMYVLSQYTESSQRYGDASNYHGGRDIWLFRVGPDHSLEWQLCLGGSGSDYASSLELTDDLGVLVLGTTSSNDGDIKGRNHGARDVWLIKVSPSGTIERDMLYGGGGDESSPGLTRMYRVNSTSYYIPDGYLIHALTNSSDQYVQSHGGTDVLLVKIDDDSSIEWQRSIGGSRDDSFSQLEGIPQTGEVLMSMTSESNDGDIPGNFGKKDIVCLALNETDGTTLWCHHFGGSDDDTGGEIDADVVYSNGGYLVRTITVVGTTFSSDYDAHGNHGGSDILLVALDENGDTVGHRCLGGSNNDSTSWYGIQYLSGNRTMLVGTTESSDGDLSGRGYHGGDDIWVSVFSEDGSVQWSRSYGGSSDESLQSYTRISCDSSLVFIANTPSTDGNVSPPSQGSNDIWLFSLDDTSGTILSRGTFGGVNDDQANRGVYNSTLNTYVLCGNTQSPIPGSGYQGSWDLWIMGMQFPFMREVTANFSANLTSGTAPLSVQFQDESPGSPNSWYWQFGDGYSYEQNPVHQYRWPGVYNVTLRAGYCYRYNTLTKEYYINVSSPPTPVANFTGTPLSGEAPLTVNFTDRSLNSPYSWSWQFGDGAWAYEQNPSHTYSSPGLYSVGLTVGNSQGYNSSVRNAYIFVYLAGNPPEQLVVGREAGGNCSGGWKYYYIDLPSGKNVSISLTPSIESSVFTLYGAYDHVPDSITYDVVQAAKDGNGSYVLVIPSTREGRYYVGIQSYSSSNDFTVFPTFDQESITYTITASAGTGGTIAPSGVISVAVGANQSFSIVPDTGYAIEDILVDGTSVGMQGTYTFLNVHANHTIDASFTPVTYIITASAGTGGTIAPSGVISVAVGANQSFSIVPDTGYAIEDILVDGTSVGTGGSFQFTSIDRNHTISASFSQVQTVNASFTANKTEGYVPLVVQFTDTSSGSPTTWGWDFGDGSPGSTEQNPVHQFLTNGTYSVTLTALSATGSSTVSYPGLINVTAAPLHASFFSNVTSGIAPLAVQFVDASTGAPILWDWDFGDGSAPSPLQNPIHVYQDPGQYTIRLTISDTTGSDSFTTPGLITVSSPLHASFTANVTSGALPLVVQFTDTSTGAPASWNWSFGDGSFSDEQNPVHVFSSAGTYSVNLSVSDGNVTDSIEKVDFLQAGEGELVANFTASRSAGMIPFTVAFTDFSTGAVTSWTWSFGDGSANVTDQNPVHVFNMPGYFTVSLTVGDGSGMTSATTLLIYASHGGGGGGGGGGGFSVEEPTVGPTLTTVPVTTLPVTTVQTTIPTVLPTTTVETPSVTPQVTPPGTAPIPPESLSGGLPLVLVVAPISLVPGLSVTILLLFISSVLYSAEVPVYSGILEVLKRILEYFGKVDIDLLREKTKAWRSRFEEIWDTEIHWGITYGEIVTIVLSTVLLGFFIYIASIVSNPGYNVINAFLQEGPHGYWATLTTAFLMNWTVALPIVMLGGFALYITHELGHKVAASRYEASFRYRPWGLGIFIIFITSWFGTVFGYPSGSHLVEKRPISKTERVYINLAGSLATLMFGFALLGLLYGLRTFGITGIEYSCVEGCAKTAFFMVIFLLIPMKFHEGRPIWEWKKWVTASLLVVALLAILSAYSMELFSLLRCEQIPFVRDAINIVQNLLNMVPRV
jgi:PKD repeat protein